MELRGVVTSPERSFSIRSLPSDAFSAYGWGGGGIQYGESWNTLHRSQDGYELPSYQRNLVAFFFNN
jgi:hypothetical protein|tara:strand:+ start:85 stop:285 length:201 start_codon:yes stop_codon:yes gene_type:complete